MEPEKSIIREFLNGGWVITLIGAAAMMVRLVSFGAKMSIFEYLKKIFIASATCSIAWALLDSTDIDTVYKAITYGVIGVISPEFINGLVKLGEKFASDPVRTLSKRRSSEK
jgi:hypothetical protein